MLFAEATSFGPLTPAAVCHQHRSRPRADQFAV